MVCRDNLPLSTSEHEGFKRFVKKAVPQYKLPCRTTLTRMIDTKYEFFKKISMAEFATLKSVTLTCDIWTEDQTKQSYLGITVHYLPDSGSDDEICSANIGVVPLSESHTSAYIAKVICESLSDWNISTDSISLMVTDNGANMVAAAREVFGSSRHIGCIGHTLNLIVTQAVAASPALETVIQKVKSIVTFFKNSVTASDNSKKMQLVNGKTEGTLLKLIQDVETRWNSKYQMMERFVALADLISAVLLKLGNTGRDMLTGSELAIIKEAIKLLKPIFRATEELSAEKYTSTSKVIPICYIMRQVRLATFQTSFEYIRDRTTQQFDWPAKTKLAAWDGQTLRNVERVHVYSISTLLDPRFKRLHFSSALTQSEAIQHVSNMMKANLRTSEPEARVSVQKNLSAQIDPDDFWSIHDSIIAATPSVPGHDAPGGIPIELRQFLNTPTVLRTTNPITECRRLKVEYPCLSQIAFKYLSMVATSVPAERLFFKAGSIVTKQRNRLLGKRISKLLFLGSLSEDRWFK
ncbi:E3 SUMO-protein ligase ZBED1-like [Diprion similis]|uniref:E3 SUMO-protein ligase ZBED1-like n=1 Tax=Diprion similis TaxID=362088 RepID=UPI001EF92EFD|nr:E3 SUMO-protein ligase ZBED1-like [Diprion similis]